MHSLPPLVLERCSSSLPEGLQLLDGSARVGEERLRGRRRHAIRALEQRIAPEIADALATTRLHLAPAIIPHGLGRRAAEERDLAHQGQLDRRVVAVQLTRERLAIEDLVAHVAVERLAQLATGVRAQALPRSELGDRDVADQWIALAP